MKTFRKWLAEFLFPELVEEAEKWQWAEIEISDMQRWLGHEYPTVDLSLECLRLKVRNRFRALDEDVLELKCRGVAHRYVPQDICSYRDFLRRNFAAHYLRPQPAVKSNEPVYQPVEAGGCAPPIYVYREGTREPVLVHDHDPEHWPYDHTQEIVGVVPAGKQDDWVVGRKE